MLKLTEAQQAKLEIARAKIRADNEAMRAAAELDAAEIIKAAMKNTMPPMTAQEACALLMDETYLGPLGKTK